MTEADGSLSASARALATVAGGVSGGMLGFNRGSGEAGLSVPLPFEHDITLVEDTVIAGATHIEGIEDIAAKLDTGTKLRFERDTRNRYDACAIRVFFGKDRIGFVSAEDNAILAHLMDGGKRVFGTVTTIEKVGSWIKIHMEVRMSD